MVAQTAGRQLSDAGVPCTACNTCTTLGFGGHATLLISIADYAAMLCLNHFLRDLKKLAD